MTPISLTTIPKPIYVPSKECLRVLSEKSWVATYSGGKDSTSVVTWIEWLRRVGFVHVKSPRLVLSDTEVEFPFLQETTTGLLGVMRRSGWDCTIVRPPIHKKLFNSIFGRGLAPIHPAGKKMRWCTNATKIGPMERFGREVKADLMVTGVRWGESERRDGQLKTSGCAAGGECGLPAPREGNADGLYAPIVNWRTCQVVSWLRGEAGGNTAETMADVLVWTKRLVDVYEVPIEEDLGVFPPREQSTLRFGCVGCPAWTRDRSTRRQIEQYPNLRHVHEFYGIWESLRSFENRLFRWVDGKCIHGPIKMEARRKMFPRFMEIQAKCGLELVAPEDEKFIRDCWERGVYPRGWSTEDEIRCARPIMNLFEEQD